MIQELIRVVKWLWGLVGMLLVIVFLGVCAFVMWHFYEDERFHTLFRNEGKPITVRVTNTDRNPRAIWDKFRSPAYVRFTYQNQSYETRYVNDTLWVSAGDQITLLYHPQLNAFRQPEWKLTSSPTRVVSRLVKWSVVGEFRRENQLLGGLILVMLALFFCVSAVIVTLTGFTLIQTIARFILVIAFGAAAFFTTYDTIRCFRYADELRTNGRSMDVVALDADRTSQSRGTTRHHRRNTLYRYDATFRFKGQERVIAIEEADYNRIESGNTRLAVQYNPALDDFIAANYSPAYSRWFVPVVFLILLISVARSKSGRTAPQPKTVP